VSAHRIISKPLSLLIPVAEQHTQPFLIGLLALKTKMAAPTNASIGGIITAYISVCTNTV